MYRRILTVVVLGALLLALPGCSSASSEGSTTSSGQIVANNQAGGGSTPEAQPAAFTFEEVQALLAKADKLMSTVGIEDPAHEDPGANLTELRGVVITDGYTSENIADDGSVIHSYDYPKQQWTNVFCVYGNLRKSDGSNVESIVGDTLTMKLGGIKLYIKFVKIDGKLLIQDIHN